MIEIEIQTDRKSIKKYGPGHVIYKVNGKTKRFMVYDCNLITAVLEGMVAAFKEIKGSGNIVEIKAPYTYMTVELNRGLIFDQASRGYKKASGKDLANRELIKKLVKEIVRTTKAIKVVS